MRNSKSSRDRLDNLGLRRKMELVWNKPPMSWDHSERQIKSDVFGCDSERSGSKKKVTFQTVRPCHHDTKICQNQWWRHRRHKSNVLLNLASNLMFKTDYFEKKYPGTSWNRSALLSTNSCCWWLQAFSAERKACRGWGTNTQFIRVLCCFRSLRSVSGD